MPLDPQVQQFLEQGKQQASPSPEQVGPAEARRQLMESARLLGPFPELASIEDRVIPGPAGPLPIRIYRPIHSTTPVGVAVYFHGGGWVIGNIETHDGYCRELALASGAIVVMVDYRLAPEHPYPAALDDCYATTCWVAEHAATFGGDPQHLAVVGDSAGGNLAAAVCLAARDRGGPRLAFQLLIYPVTDAGCETPSYHENAEGYYLTRDAMLWFWQQYVPHAPDRQHPLASPLRGDLRGLPPALVLTAEYDPLRDEGEDYAARLSIAGVPTRLIRYPGMIHGFARRTKLFRVAQQAIEDAGQALRQALEAE